jgi:uncharacterized membrane protein YdbT with pleckstrin-like domain
MSKPKVEKRQEDFPGQHPGEEVILVFRQHPVVMRKALIFGMLAMLVGILPLMLFPLSDTALKIALFIPLGVIAFWFYNWVGWHYSVYIVTGQRLIDIHQKGFFNRRVNEVGFDKVQSINYHINGFQAAILKFGDITVQTYTGDWVLKDIAHPVEVHTCIMDAARLITSTPPVK